MRRLAALPLAAALLAVLPGGGGAHPGHGQFVMVDVGRFAFSPARVEVTEGEEVLWNWAGPDRNHTVTADDGSFDSDPGRLPGPAGRGADEGFSHAFAAPGEVPYHCKVHPGMRGVVVVEPRPPADPAPVVSDLRAPVRVRTRLTLRFTLSEPAVLLLEVDRLRPERLVLSRARRFEAGPGRLDVAVGRLRPGRYRVQLVPVDDARNAGEPARATVRVVERRRRG
jgi:plastocyanin